MYNAIIIIVETNSIREDNSTEICGLQGGYSVKENVSNVEKSDQSTLMANNPF